MHKFSHALSLLQLLWIINIIIQIDCVCIGWFFIVKEVKMLFYDPIMENAQVLVY